MARRALVTGVGGFVATRLVPRLLEEGWTVRGSTSRLGAVEVPAAVELVSTGPIGPNTDWTRALAGVDVVFHLASRVHMRDEGTAAEEAAYLRTNAEGTSGLVRAAVGAGVERIVFVSTVKVNGSESVRPYSGDDVPNPQDAYGRSKLRAEMAVREAQRETGIRGFVLRPPLVYGPGVGANFLALIRLADLALPLPLASIDNRRSLVGVTNLVDAMIACATSDHPGGTFMVSDGDDVSTPELVRRIAVALRRPSRLFGVPPTWLRHGLDVPGLRGVASRLLGSLCVDSSPLRSELGWHPPCSVAEELEATARWYRARR